jgi:hypothetical protein
VELELVDVVVPVEFVEVVEVDVFECEVVEVSLSSESESVSLSLDVPVEVVDELVFEFSPALILSPQAVAKTRRIVAALATGFPDDFIVAKLSLRAKEKPGGTEARV